MAHGPAEGADPTFDVGWAGDVEGVPALVLVERGEKEQGDSPEVIPVEVGDEDGLDLVAFDTDVLQTGAGRCSAVEEQRPPFSAHEDRRLSTASGPEGITRSDKEHFAHVWFQLPQ